MPSTTTIALLVIAAWLGSALLARVFRGVQRHLAGAIAFSILPPVALAASLLVFRGQPHLPPREDADRLLIFGVPFAVMISVLTASARPWCWWVRAAAVAVMVRLVLHGSSYVSPTGGGHAWTLAQQFGHLAMWAFVVTGTWWLTQKEVRSQPAVNTGYRLALAALASGLVAVPSGYISVGLALVVLAAAAFGWAWGRGVGKPGSASDAVETAHWLLWVGLLAAASYFADLPLWAAWGLLAVPALTWLTFLARPAAATRRRPAADYLVVLLGTVALIAGVFWHNKVHTQSAPTTSGQPSLHDYMSFPGSSSPPRQ